MEDNSTGKSKEMHFQSRLGLALIGLLMLIAGALLWEQQRYDPANWREQSGNRLPASQATESHSEAIVPLSPAERYTADNLSDKINGKADLYLSAGFKALESRRFALAADKNRWMERYVYDMGDHPNAFAVYSVQRRSEIQAIDTTTHAYLASNGLFMVHGPYYVEIISSEASAEMQTRLKDLGAAFVKAYNVPPGALPELNLFGAVHNVPGSHKLIADSAFGIQGMNWVYTSSYTDGSSHATAFVAKRASAAQADASAEAFISFWNEYGAETVAAPRQLPSARIVLILDNYEVAMVSGAYFFGVHEASGLDFGLKVVSQLKQAIGEAAP